MKYLEKLVYWTANRDLEYREVPIECIHCRLADTGKKHYSKRGLDQNLELDFRVEPKDAAEARLMSSYNMYRFTCNNCGSIFYKCVWKNTDLIHQFLNP